ncbi:MAG TPA: ring-cleaving dioxygenase [Aggregatilineaceae bacterium]|nr:ring-cleaving dioxygenase [Aggregatilineaceae bacterium]
MTEPLTGIHHVTAIASDPQRNVDFYAGVLGMRLVKQTVNFDDPGTYHFYYGDALGHPGTILTFFPWPGARRGRRGAGQIGATAFSVPVASLGFWRERLAASGVEVASDTRFEQDVLTFADPDGLALELVGDAGVETIPGWEGGPVAAQHAIRGVHSVTLWEADADVTDQVLRGALGFTAVDHAGERTRYHIVESALDSDSDSTTGIPIGTRVDVLHLPGAAPAAGGAGTVHHVAWRTGDRDQQQAWQARISARGLHVTDILDRQYFTSIYFREPGGVLFEIATDPPGFTLDEAPGALGTALKLPPWYEEQRALIERVLPPIRLPGREDARG